MGRCWDCCCDCRPFLLACPVPIVIAALLVTAVAPLGAVTLSSRTALLVPVWVQTYQNYKNLLHTDFDNQKEGRSAG